MKIWIPITKSDLTGFVFVVVVKMFTHEPDVTKSVEPRPSPISIDIVNFLLNLNRESGHTNHTQMCVTQTN